MARIRKIEPHQETIDGQTAEVLPTEKKSYDAAMELFKSRDYKAAATALQDFVRRFPDSAYAANAQYWLGNAYYAQRDYKNAIAAQELVVSNYGASGKAPGNDADRLSPGSRGSAYSVPKNEGW